MPQKKVDTHPKTFSLDTTTLSNCNSIQQTGREKKIEFKYKLNSLNCQKQIDEAKEVNKQLYKSSV